MGADEIPTWNGDPSSFEAFATSCRWYERSLKDSERKLAASRIWQKLSGAAKSVVRHLDPDDFDKDDGLRKLLAVLRDSPLQQLPVPDSFSRLERWTALRRANNESIPQLLVREEELFTELQQALQRARRERSKVTSEGVGTAPPERDPSSSPSASPLAGARRRQSAEEKQTVEEDASPLSGSVDGQGSTGFFEDELRGYRLLKAARLSRTEKQHVLTLTKNSTRFLYIRRSLRTLFSEDPSEGHDVRGKVWWNEPDETWHGEYQEDYVDTDNWWYDDHETYYGNYDYGTDDWGYFENYDQEDLVDEMADDFHDVADTEEGKELEQAFTAAEAATATLAKARQAVAKVRAARGYFDPNGIKGSGSSFKGSSKGKGKGKPSRSAFGPCFICGNPNHGYQQCPDRWSKGQPQGAGKGSKGSGKKGKGKGKPSKGKKGKSKSSFYTEDVHFNYSVGINLFQDFPEINVLSMEDDSEALALGTAKAIIDTGATESVAGIQAMARLLDSSSGRLSHSVVLMDRPSFRFGNGMSQRATSRVDLVTVNGPFSFYLLDGEAQNTPPLLGGRELSQRRAVISYDNNFLVYLNGNTQEWMKVPIQQLRGKHLVIDLNVRPQRLDGDRLRRLPQGPSGPPGRPDDDEDDDEDLDGPSPPPGGGRGVRPSVRKSPEDKVFTSSPSLGVGDDPRDRTRSPPGLEDVGRAPPFNAFPEVPRGSRDLPLQGEHSDFEAVPTSPADEGGRHGLGEQQEEEQPEDDPPVTHSPFFSLPEAGEPPHESSLDTAAGQGLCGENDARDPGEHALQDMVGKESSLGDVPLYMVVRDEHGMSEIERETAETYQRIARIESSLRANGHTFSEAGSPDYGSSPAWVAMHGRAQGGEDAPEQVRHLAAMREVRPEAPSSTSPRTAITDPLAVLVRFRSMSPWPSRS